MDFEEVPSDLFVTVKFYVIGNINPEIEKLLLKGGAQKHQYLSDILTHCIADEFDEEITEAKELFQLTVVKSSWVRQSLLCKSLLPAKAFDADFSDNYFSGIVACPSKLSKRDHLLMWCLITTHGGEYKNKFDKTVTHLITNSISGAKYECASKNNVKVVCALWITESISNKRKLLESQYHPKHFTVCSMSPMTENSQEAIDDKLLDNRSDPSEDVQPSCTSPLEDLGCHLEGRNIEQSNAREDVPNTTLQEPSLETKFYGHDPNENLPTAMFLHGCIFHICDYQSDLAKEEIDLWEQVIELHGGQVDDQYSSRVTHVLCEHQKSSTFQQALKDNKRIVTACWLNDCLVEKCMLVPSSVLHVPQPFGKEKPCANQVISVTNFVGEERIQIKKLILLLGAKYSGCMTRAVSVLVAKSPTGSKHNKALEWNVPVVSLDWLIELAFGNLEVLRLPISKQYKNFDCRGLSNTQEKICHLMNGWKVPLKVKKDILEECNDSIPNQLQSLPADLEVCRTILENKENLMTE